MIEPEEKKAEEEQFENRFCAWNPDDGITLEWWGRAEGLEDEQ